MVPTLWCHFAAQRRVWASDVLLPSFSSWCTCRSIPKCLMETVALLFHRGHPPAAAAAVTFVLIACSSRALAPNANLRGCSKPRLSVSRCFCQHPPPSNPSPSRGSLDMAAHGRLAGLGAYLTRVSGIPMAGGCEGTLLPEVAPDVAYSCARGWRM